MHSTQVNKWKSNLLDMRVTCSNAHAIRIWCAHGHPDLLYANIGLLKMDLGWLNTPRNTRKKFGISQ